MSEMQSLVCGMTNAYNKDLIIHFSDMDPVQLVKV